MLLALLWAPVIFLPLCFATYVLIVVGGKEAVSGEVRTDFFILTSTKDMLGIVPYRSNEWRSETLTVREFDRERIAGYVIGSPPMTATARADAMQNGLQRIHVEVRREGKKGTRVTESWYDTDGVRVIPRYEREYSPWGNALVGTIVAAPLSLFLAILIAGRTRRAP